MIRQKHEKLINIRLSTKMKNNLEAVAKENITSVSEVVRFAIETYLK